MPRIKESIITVLPMNINFHILVKLPKHPKRETSYILIKQNLQNIKKKKMAEG